MPPHAPPATLQTGFGGRDATPAAGTGRSPPSQICSVPAAQNQVLPDPVCAFYSSVPSVELPNSTQKDEKKEGKKKKKSVGTLQVLEEGSGDGNGSAAPRALVARPSSRVEGSGAGGRVLLPCALLLRSIPWEEEGGARVAEGLRQGRGCPWVHPEAGSCPRQIWGADAGPGSQRRRCSACASSGRRAQGVVG